MLMFQLNSPILVISGIAFMATAWAFWVCWNKYSKFWKFIFVICSVYALLFGTLTLTSGFVIIYHKEWLWSLLGDFYSYYMVWSALVLVGLWWVPWFKRNWRQFIEELRKSGYLD